MGRARRVLRWLSGNGYVPALVVLLCGLSASVGLSLLLRDSERHRGRAEFEDRTHALANALQNGVESHLEVLRSVPAMQLLAETSQWSGPEHPASVSLTLIIQDAARRYPGVLALGTASPPAAMAEGVQLDPAPSQPVPFLPLRQGGPPGFPDDLNLAAVPSVHAALETARDSGLITAAPETPAVSGAYAGRGFVAVLPLYGTTEIPAGVAERRATLSSYIVGLFDGDALLAVATGKQDAIQVWVEDVTSGSSSKVIAGAASGPAETSATFTVAGRTWLVQFRPADPAAFAGRQWPQWGALAGSVALTLLTANYLGLVTNRSRRISRLAAEREREIGERKRAEAALRERESWFRALVQHSSDVVTVMSADGGIEWISPSVEWVLGHDPELMRGASVLAFVHPADMQAVADGILRAVVRPGRHEPAAFRVLRAGGAWRWLEVTTTNLLDDPVVGAVVLNARDITERRELEEELTRQAFSDSLTGLPNRALFHDRLTHALAASRRHAIEVGVIFLDLDGFKVVNDSLGHQAGDALLVTVAARLLHCLRPSDTVARLGGDEFAVLVRDAHGQTAAPAVAERLLQALRAPIELEGREVVVAASAGVAVSDGKQDRPEELLRRADIALYRAKGAGKDRVAVFDGSMETAVASRLDLEMDLRRALEREEFAVYYQPEVNTATGATSGVEALLRWRHPDRGAISPLEFVPVAEETGVILPLGAWVLREACAQVRRWQRSGLTPESFTLSVNLSGRQLAQPDLVEVVAAALTEAELPPAMLRLEITETVLMEDGPASARTLDGLKALGVQLAIDDFGTGYSSLAYLRRFPVDMVKIDRSFIAAVEDDPRARAIVQTVTHLAHVLGMQVTAEGIETDQHLRFVVEAGCDRGQGFFYSRPLPAVELERLLAAGDARAA